MKGEFRAMEAHLKELKALKRYKEAERLKEELCQLKARLSELEAENGRLKKELILNTNVEREACELREALNQTKHELSMLKEVKVIINGEHLTLEEAAREFVKAKEGEIRARAEAEFKQLRKGFAAKMSQLVYQKLLAVLKKPQWPPEIAQVIDEKAEEKAQSKLDEQFQQRVHEETLGRLEEVKQTDWRPFVEEQVSRIARDLRTLVAELQGTWHLTCDRCHRSVTAEVGPREIAALLKGERVAECPRCTDFNFPPSPPIAPHRINGSALEDLLEAYFAEKGPLGKATTEGT